MDGLQFRLLGPVEVLTRGSWVQQPPSKQLTVLTTLLLHPNAVLSWDSLAEAVWGEQAQCHERAALQNHVMRLRRALRTGGSDSTVRTSPGGYQIDLPWQAVDMWVFRDLLDRGRHLADPGDLTQEAACLRDALVLWRGPPLSNVRSDLLHREVVPQLTEQYLGALERTIEIELALGQFDDVLPRLWSLTAEYPRRERFWCQLMKALSRSGRRGEALDVYERVRRSLADELGVDPGAELRRCHLDVLRGEGADKPRDRSSWTAAAGADVSGSARLPRPGCHLPPDVTGFVGRDRSLDAVTTAVVRVASSGEPSIVAVCGSPCVGKTALAVRAAHRLRDTFPDGQLFLSLRSLVGRRRELGAVLADLLQLAGFDIGRLPGELSARAAAFRAYLAKRRALVVLDDVADDARLRLLVPGSGKSAVLVTSRTRLLGLAASQACRPFRLPPLEESHSVDLLTSHIGSERVVAEVEAARRLATVCAGLPLALRIAGAYLSSRPPLSVADFVDELLDGEDLIGRLQVGCDVARSIEGEFDVSYARMGNLTRRLFCLLGQSHDADFGAAAAARMLDCDLPFVRPLLDELCNRNLLQEVTRERYQWCNSLLRRYARRKATQCEADPSRSSPVERSRVGAGRAPGSSAGAAADVSTMA